MKLIRKLPEILKTISSPRFYFQKASRIPLPKGKKIRGKPPRPSGKR